MRRFVRRARARPKKSSVKRKKRYSKKDICVSGFEKEVKKFLESLGIQVETQFKLNYKYYDFRIKNTMLLIEADGSYWHADPAIYKEGTLNKVQKACVVNDKYKNGLANKFGYKLLRIWENDFKKNRQGVKLSVLKFIADNS